MFVERGSFVQMDLVPLGPNLDRDKTPLDSGVHTLYIYDLTL